MTSIILPSILLTFNKNQNLNTNSTSKLIYQQTNINSFSTTSLKSINTKTTKTSTTTTKKTIEYYSYG